MSKAVQINIRTNSDLKSEVEDILKKLGLNHSQAVNIFYNQILLNRGLPFEVKLLEKEIPNKETLESIKEYEEGNFKTAKNSKDLFKKMCVSV